MSMSKPSRDAQLLKVQKLFYGNTRTPLPPRNSKDRILQVDPYAVLKFLRAQRAALVRVIKQQRASLLEPPNRWGSGYIQACDDLLAAVRKR